MIRCYTGTMGSGKSLSVAKDIFFYNNKGKDIILNYSINKDLLKDKGNKIIELNNNSLNVKFLKDFAKQNNYLENKKEKQCILIVDEASIIFNSRSWNAKDRTEWLEFFVHHRKLGFEVILITQFLDQLDKQIRNIIEYQYIHRKLNNFLPLPFKTFVKVEKSVQVKGLKSSSRMFIFKKKYGNLYDTFAMFD
ncbi:MAG: zonular occludens toxin domain-containing protein [Peptostreptococcaceae bacterium]